MRTKKINNKFVSIANSVKMDINTQLTFIKRQYGNPQIQSDQKQDSIQ